MDASGRRKVIIVGAGFGGLTAAKKLARADIDLTVIDRRNHHLFQPLLYQVATAALSPADIAVPIRSVLRTSPDRPVRILMDEVDAVDLSGKTVGTAGGAVIPYDELILATGSRYNYFGHEADWATAAPSIKTIDDALNIRRRVLLAFERAETTTDLALRDQLMSFAVIGGGPTGVETAGALAELARATLARDFRHIDPRRAKVYLIEALDKVLNGYPEPLSAYTADKLRAMGVEVLTGAPVEDIDAKGVRLKDRTVLAANVIWCAGVKATPAGDWLGVETEKNGTLRVREDLTLPGHPEIFVVGDLSFLETGDGPVPALAPAAKQQGRYAAEVILRRKDGRSPQPSFRYRDWGTLATIGRAAAVGKFGPLELTGFPAWLVWGVVHIAYLVGFRNRLAVMLNWFWAWLTYAKGARLITGPDTASVAALDSPRAVEEELDRTVAHRDAGG